MFCNLHFQPVQSAQCSQRHMHMFALHMVRHLRANHAGADVWLPQAENSAPMQAVQPTSRRAMVQCIWCPASLLLQQLSTKAHCCKIFLQMELRQAAFPLPGRTCFCGPSLLPNAAR